MRGVEKIVCLLCLVWSGLYAVSGKNKPAAMLPAFHIDNLHRISPNSFLKYRQWENSQFGEDGIITEIFRRIGIDRGFFVEFGAMDGVKYSNTYNLYKHGWQGFYIEINPKYRKKLLENFPPSSGVGFVIEKVAWDKDDNTGKMFDQIANSNFPGREIDFLSIDIDGCDYYVLKSLQCRPKVICIECGHGWHPLETKEISEKLALENFRAQPHQVYLTQAIKMGYTPITFNVINLFLVRNDLAHLFKETPKDMVTMFVDSFRVSPNNERLLQRRIDLYMPLENPQHQIDMPITLDL